MKHATIEDLQRVASVSARPLPPLTRGERLVRWAELLEQRRGEHLSTWWSTPLLENTADVQLAQGLEPAADEKMILKRRYSGFYQTDLELTLRCLRIKQVVIGGVFTNVCPFSTAFDAFFRDFDVYFLADGTAAANRELHVNALRSIAGWCGHVVRSRDMGAWLQ